MTAQGPRIVSLLPAGTEIVCALGLEEALVGRSHECDHPPSVGRLPVCSAPRVDTGAASAAIDRDVRQRLRAGLSVFEVFESVLGRLAPTHLLTQTQCEVCAVTLEDVERAVAGWSGSRRRPRIVSLAPASLADVWRDIERVAAALGVPDRGAALAASLQARLRGLERRAGALPRRPRVACIEWTEPLMAAGNWVPELVALAGGESPFGAPGAHSPWLAWEDLAAADPDAVVVMPCGYDLERTRGELPVLAAQPAWSRLRAVRAGRVALVDGHRYFNRPGPRLVESAEILAEILHPDEFDFGHRGRGWAGSGESA